MKGPTLYHWAAIQLEVLLVNGQGRATQCVFENERRYGSGQGTLLIARAECHDHRAVVADFVRSKLLWASVGTGGS